MKRATGDLPADVKDGVISIHTLCEEGDDVRQLQANIRFRFQSTPSVKRATVISMPAKPITIDFNPHPL